LEGLCGVRRGCARAFGIDDEESFAHFDIYIGVASRLAKEVFQPMNEDLQSAPHPLQQGHRLLMVQFYATKVLAICDGFSAFDRCVIPADGVRMYAAGVRDYERKYPLAALAAYAAIGLSPALWPMAGRPETLVGKAKWWSDVPLNEDRIRAIQRTDLRLLVHSVLLLSNSLGDPTIDGIMRRPEPFMRALPNGNWDVIALHLDEWCRDPFASEAGGTPAADIVNFPIRRVTDVPDGPVLFFPRPDGAAADPSDP
jgi:hypothetical protein